MRKFLIATAVAGGLGYGAHAWWRAEEPNVTHEHDPTLVTDRVWIDHIPRHERDVVQVFAALSPRRHGPIGVFEAVSRWRGEFEAFRYETHGREMRVVFPHDGQRETLQLTATRCREHGMDYCLEISGNSRGVARYYSKKGWELRELADVADITTRVTATLAP